MAHEAEQYKNLDTALGLVLPNITYRTALQWRPEDGTPLPDDTIITLNFGGNTVELRHKGTYLEVHGNVRTSFCRMVIEPRVSNEVWIRLEPDR